MEETLKTMAEVVSADDPLKCIVMVNAYTALNNELDKTELAFEEIAVKAKEQYDLQKTAENSVSKFEHNLNPTHVYSENDYIPFKENENSKSDSTTIRNKRKLENDADFLIDSAKKLNPSPEEKKIANLRRNIRDVMGENQLDTNTLVAQREESDRLARVAEQQKIIREYQRQTAVNKQNVRTQNRVLSLLQSANTFAKVTDLTDECPLSITPKSSVQEINSDLVENIGDCNKLTAKAKSETGISNAKIANVISSDKISSNDIVTIEDSSSEDDCILLSDDEEEDPEQDIEDDPSNSGLHVKDVYNVPDEKGRVVVNVGHPEGEEDIFLAPQIARTIKPHQIGGVRFLFDNIIESTKRFNSSTGFGCILAHSMGLGKTLQVVCFCDIFLRHTNSKTVLCVMPINTLQNWVSEFNMWTPLESTFPENLRPRSFNVFVLNDQQKTLNARGKIILKWAAEGGVLLMGYELFRLLALKLIPNRKRRVGKTSGSTEKVETEAHKRLTESIYQALVKPGPDLVICDEGHRIKNSHAGISLALKQIRTRRRIVLTGYPLQNNLMEYWCMVDFVRPNYLGTRTEFSNMFERPIQNGQCIDSTPEDIKLMRYRAHVLHSLLVGFVQRRSHVVLQHTLPQKLEYVILTKMNEFQRKLYDTFMNDVVRKKTVPNPLKAFAVCCKIWNHPDVLYNFLKKRETDLDLEIDDPDGTAESLKVNADKTDDSLSSHSCITHTKNPNVDLDLTSSEEKIESKTQDKDLLKLNTNADNSFLMSKKSNSTINAYSGILDSKNLNKIFPNDYFSQNYYQSSCTETYIPECNEDTYWHDSNPQYYGYHSLCSNVDPPQKPDYVGMVVKEKQDLQNLNGSSQIVDLDTKEIKIVETDIDLTTNQIVNNIISCKKKPTIPRSKDNFGQNKELCKETSLGNTHFNSAAITTLSNSSKQTIGLLTSSEKESLKVRNEDVIPYDWAADIMKGYEPNLLRNSPKMEIFFCILNESINKGDRVLLFSQSLLTLNLIEKFLQLTPAPDSNQFWTRNVSYFRLDGSTASQEREKLVNDFNSNSNIALFLISTKAGSLGINLVGANRVIVFDASWNPCHDTQAVYRIYRYGQKKPCFVYRIVMDKCLEKKIYDRQVKKQGMSDRVVDECNPDAHLSMKDVTNLCYDYDTDNEQSLTEFKKPIDSYTDTIIQKIIETNKDALSKEPFHHESLLIDRKEKKLSLAEKRQAQRGYELEKKASSKHLFSCQPNKLQYRIVRNDGTIVTRPVASVRPMQTVKIQNGSKSSGIRSTRWIPAEVWQRQGMTAQEMTLPLDVVIPTNSSEKSNIILKSGQRVMVLKSPKGIYMQLESGKIIAIRTSSKINPLNKNQKDSVIDISSDTNTRTKQTGIVKENGDMKSVENLSKNGCITKESSNIKVVSGLNCGLDKVVKSTEKILKSPSSNNLTHHHFQNQLKKSLIPKQTKCFEDFVANKMSTPGRRFTTSSSNGKSILSPLIKDKNEIILKKKESSSNALVYQAVTSKTVDVVEPNTDCQYKLSTTDLADGKSTHPKIATPLQFASPVVEVNNHPNKINYVCNSTPDTLNPEYDAMMDLQISSAQKSPQSNKLQHQQLAFPQQHHQEQKEPFVSVYNVQHSHYADKVQQLITSHVTGNALLTSLESTPHRQYYDTIYDNGLSYEYQHRYPNYPSHSSYASPHQHYSPHYHNFSSTQTNTITTNPYYMQWPPMSNVNQTNNQHNINPSCSQTGTAASQWHN